jgi:hypothetical protein
LTILSAKENLSVFRPTSGLTGHLVPPEYPGESPVGFGMRVPSGILVPPATLLTPRDFIYCRKVGRSLSLGTAGTHKQVRDDWQARAHHNGLWEEGIPQRGARSGGPILVKSETASCRNTGPSNRQGRHPTLSVSRGILHNAVTRRNEGSGSCSAPELGTLLNVGGGPGGIFGPGRAGYSAR